MSHSHRKLVSLLYWWENKYNWNVTKKDPFSSTANFLLLYGIAFFSSTAKTKEKTNKFRVPSPILFFFFFLSLSCWQLGVVWTLLPLDTWFHFISVATIGIINLLDKFGLITDKAYVFTFIITSQSQLCCDAYPQCRQPPYTLFRFFEMRNSFSWNICHFHRSLAFVGR